jgi:hypothetical protein
VDALSSHCSLLATLLALVVTAAAPGAVRAEPPAEAEKLDAAAIRALVEKMVRAELAVRDYTMIMVKTERTGDVLPPRQSIAIKWARPQRVYLRYLDGPKAGREVIYDPVGCGPELVVHLGSFPDLTLHLDPRGSLAMEGGHHPIYDVNLNTFVHISTQNMLLLAERGDGEVRLVREGMWGRPVLHLWLSMPAGGTNHVLQEGEDLWALARRLDRNMADILHHNQDKGWEAADDPCPGDEVFVPTYYASRAEVWIDAESYLPLKAQFYDHQGRLYEDYVHRDLRVNVGLTDRDFDTDSPDYKF